MTAREYAKLRIGRWREADWLKLTADAQWLYDFLASQPTTNSAGVFPIQRTKWAKGAADMTVERVTAAARMLDDRKFIVVDHDTEEGVIRSYIRDDAPCEKVLLGALRCAAQAQSPLLRLVLLNEARQLDRTLGRTLSDRAAELITELEDTLSGFAPPPTSPPPSTATGPIERHPKGNRNASESHYARRCEATNRDGSPCGNPADGVYGIWCKYHEEHGKTR